MLLKFIRKHLKLFFIFVLSFMIVPFLFWGMSSYTRQRGQEKETTYRIHGKTVSRALLRKASIDSRIHLIIDFAETNNITAEQFGIYQNWLNQLLGRTDFNRLAVQQLLLQEQARRYGFLTTRKEVAKWLENFPLFQTDGQFDIEIYQGIVANLFNTWPAQFEESLMRILTVKKLQNLILDSVFVSTDESFNVYKERNEKVIVYYTEFNNTDYMGKVGILEKKELENYYNKHQEEFREPDKIKIVYLLFDPETITEKVEIGPKEVEDYYKANPDEFKDKEKGAKSLDKVRDEIKEKLIEEKIEELNQERALAASIELTEEKRLGDLRRLAKEKNLIIKESKFISKNETIQELDFTGQLTQTIWKMDLETISDLIRIGNKWIIVSPSERKPSYIPELSEVEAQVTEQLKKQKTEELAYKDAQETLLKLPKLLPFTMAVKSLGLKAAKSKPLTRTDPLGKAAFSGIKGPVKTPLGTSIFSIKKFFPVKPEKWEEEKEKFTKNYLQAKKTSFFREWLESLGK